MADNLRALFINCTLKRSRETLHTQLLMENARAIMAANGVEVETVRAVDHEIAPRRSTRHDRAWLGTR